MNEFTCIPNSLSHLLFAADVSVCENMKLSLCYAESELCERDKEEKGF